MRKCSGNGDAASGIGVSIDSDEFDNTEEVDVWTMFNQPLNQNVNRRKGDRNNKSNSKSNSKKKSIVQLMSNWIILQNANGIIFIKNWEQNTNKEIKQNNEFLAT